jgi:T5SS/PEP-CTERM-associated repeat protein
MDWLGFRRLERSRNWETLTDPPPQGPPGAGDGVTINNQDGDEITTDGATIASLKVVSGTLDGDLTVTGEINGGVYTGGNVVAGGLFYAGTFEGTSLSAGSIEFALLDAGTVTTPDLESALVSGATVSAGTIEPTANGAVTVRVGTLSAATLSLDQQYSLLLVSGGTATIGTATTVEGPSDGAAAIIVSGGQLNLSGGLTLDGGAYLNDGAVGVSSAGGTLTVGGTGSGRIFVGGSAQVNVGSDFILGESGAGQLTVQNGGHVVVGGDMESAVESGSTATGTIVDAAADLEFDGDWEIGVEGAATWTLSEAVTASVGGSTELGVSSGGSGALTLSDAGTSVIGGGDGLTVGGEGDGTLTVQSGALFDGSAGELTVAEGEDSNGTVEIDDAGSELIVGDDATVGAAGSGTITVTGGAATFSGTLTLGESKGATGGLAVTDGGVTLAGDTTVGGSGAGSISVGPDGVIAPGTLKIPTGSTDTITLGESASGDGTLNVSGTGALVESFGLTVGGAGGGTLTIGDEGRLTTTGDATVGEDVTATIQKVTVTSAGTWAVGGDLSLGEAAVATASVTSGGLVQVDGDLTLGEDAGATGYLTVSGVLSAGSSHTPASLKWGGVMDVGEAGTGALAIFGGGQATAIAGEQGQLEIASGKGAKGTVTVSGAGSELTGQKLAVGGTATAVGGVGVLTVESGATASFAQGGVVWTGSRVTVGGALTLGALVDDGALSAAGGRIVVTGSLLGTGTVSIGAGGSFLLNAATTKLDNRVTISSNTGVFSVTGGSGADLFQVSVAALGSKDVIVGGAGYDTLAFTTAGTIAAAAFTHVSGIDAVRLPAGATTLVLANTLVTSSDAGRLAIVGGAGVDSINASDVSSGVLVFNGAATTQTIFAAGSGQVALTGGAGNDVFRFAAAALTAQDSVNGGGGSNTLVFTTAGTIKAAVLAQISGINQIDLAAGTNALVVTNALVQSAGAKTLTILGGTGADTVTAAAVTSTGEVVFKGDGGADRITGGMGINIYEVGKAAGTLTVANAFTSGTAAHGMLQFGVGLTDQSLWFEQSGANLVVDVIGTTEQVTLTGWFGTNKSAQVAEIQAGGLEIDAGVAKLVSAMAAFSAANPSFNPTAAGTTMPTDSTLQSAITANWHH